MVAATFLMEQHIGHRAYYENLRKFMGQAPGMQPSWVEITYNDESSPWQRLPLLPGSLQGTLIGRDQTLKGLQELSDIYFFNTQVPAALALGSLRGKPYVLATDLTPRQFDAIGEQYGHQADRINWLRRLKHRANICLFQGAARLLPWSTWAAESLVADYGVDPELVEVIPPGVDLNLWQPNPRHPTGPLRILFVGGDFYRKGGELLLRAFRSLPRGSAELVLVTRTELPEEPGISVHNRFQPNSPDLVALYQSCHLFVLPTKAEAFGIAAVEASAVGIPVIATNVGGVPDIVLDGRTGFLIPPNDEEALLDRLLLMLDWPELRENLGRTARARAVYYFDAHRNTARVAEILMEILER